MTDTIEFRWLVIDKMDGRQPQPQLQYRHPMEGQGVHFVDHENRMGEWITVPIVIQSAAIE